MRWTLPTAQVMVAKFLECFSANNLYVVQSNGRAMLVAFAAAMLEGPIFFDFFSCYFEKFYFLSKTRKGDKIPKNTCQTGCNMPSLLCGWVYQQKWERQTRWKRVRIWISETKKMDQTRNKMDHMICCINLFSGIDGDL